MQIKLALQVFVTTRQLICHCQCWLFLIFVAEWNICNICWSLCFYFAVKYKNKKYDEELYVIFNSGAPTAISQYISHQIFIGDPYIFLSLRIPVNVSNFVHSKIIFPSDMSVSQSVIICGISSTPNPDYKKCLSLHLHFFIFV